VTDTPQEVEGGGNVVYVKHKLFTYRVPVLDADGEPIVRQDKHGRERTKTSIRHAKRFEALNLDDVPEEEYQRGEALGAFFTDDEVAAIRSGGSSSGEGETEGGASSAPEGLNFDSQDELVAWIQNSTPTVAAVIAAADNDPDKAEALLAAEEEATGGQPRKGVVDGLNKILQQ
jgi:hypothetical protein